MQFSLRCRRPRHPGSGDSSSCVKPSSSMPFVPRSAAARRTAPWPAGTPSILPPSRSRRLVERTGIDPALDRGRDHGLRRARSASRALNIARNAALAAGFPETVAAPPSTASAARASRRALRRAGRDGRRVRLRDRRRRRVDEPRADGRERDASAAARSARKMIDRYVEGEALRHRRAGAAGRLRRDHLRRSGSSRASSSTSSRPAPTSRRRRPRRRAGSRNEILPVEITHDDGRTETDDARRGHPPRDHRGEARRAQARLRRDGRDHRRQLEPDHRRRRGRAHHGAQARRGSSG